MHPIHEMSGVGSSLLASPPQTPSKHDQGNEQNPSDISKLSPGLFDACEQKRSDLTPPQTPIPSTRSLSPFIHTPAKGLRSNRRTSVSYRVRPELKPWKSASSSSSRISLRSPDRFVSTPDSSGNTSQRFHVNKSTPQLSSTERLLRHDRASIDGFNVRQHRRQSPVTPVRGQRRPSREYRPGGPSSIAHGGNEELGGERQVSVGSVWAVGGLAPQSTGVSTGRGGMLSSGTNAPLYVSSFSSLLPKAEEDRERHEYRLAKALELDRTQRVFDYTRAKNFTCGSSPRRTTLPQENTFWRGTEWVQATARESQSGHFIFQYTKLTSPRGPMQKDGQRRLPSAPFKVLDAPNLRDDFYCSVLAYSHPCHTLAVGLGALLYTWSEMHGVHLLSSGSDNGSWITSLDFSSSDGGKCILAHGRSDGMLVLTSMFDRSCPRFELQHPYAVACVCWRPTSVQRMSHNPATPELLVKTEELVIGDESGMVYCYSVEWADFRVPGTYGPSGTMTLLSRLCVHTQQICGLAWSFNGTTLATGGNDNLCFLFESALVLPTRGDDESRVEVFHGNNGVRRQTMVVDGAHVRGVTSSTARHCWMHGAAVKAIAFCPWRDGLVATGGGSNDKCIHFFHVGSGACLATISVAAQVTSLIWSSTRREIVATFGYAQPEHPYRIAVFSWPDCKQVAAIPWQGEHRALYAIAYPGGPNEGQNNREGSNPSIRTIQEGCIVVAASDESVKFHEVWAAGRKATVGGEGLLGGSAILEGLDGIDREGEVIR